MLDGRLDVFPHLYRMLLEKYIPDHRPILLLEHWVDYGPVPFRMFHLWFNMEGFDEVVCNSWHQDHPGMLDSHP